MQRQILLLAAIFILFFNTYSQDFWQQTNGPCGGSIRSLAINQSGYIFAGTSNGGIFRSTNYGDNWTEVNSGLLDTNVGNWYSSTNVRALIVSPWGIYAGTEAGVFRSINNGENWVETGLSAGYIRSLAVNSSGHIFAGVFWGGVYRSTDYGDSWTLLNNFYNSTVYSLAINDSGHIFAASEWNVYRSKDNGDTWTQINNGLYGAADYLSLAINSSGYIFAGNEYNEVYRSTDNGDSWTLINNGIVGWLNKQMDLFFCYLSGRFHSCRN